MLHSVKILIFIFVNCLTANTVPVPKTAHAAIKTTAAAVSASLFFIHFFFSSDFSPPGITAT